MEIRNDKGLRSKLRETKESEHRKRWFLLPTIFVLPYLSLLGRGIPITGWFMGLILPVAALGAVAIWVCFFVAKRLLYSSWYLSAALIFIIGSVVSPITTLLSVHFVSVEFSLSDFVFTHISLVVFASMFLCLMVAGILVILGYTKRTSRAELPVS